MSIGNFQIDGYARLLDNSNMAQTLREIISTRLAELGRNPFEAARIGGLERSYVNDILIEKKLTVRPDKMLALARGLDMAASELFPELSGEVVNQTKLKVMGRVGAGQEILPEFEQIEPDGLFEIVADVALPEGAIAFEVEGNSMWPRYDPGDVVICWREGTNLSQVIGWEAAVQTSDGKRYLKKIVAGDKPKTFNLESHNAETIRSVKLIWISEVGTVVRQNHWRKLDGAGKKRKIKQAFSQA
jgi:phage repressor protein C with HTH and peptisase S24 domain